MNNIVKEGYKIESINTEIDRIISESRNIKTGIDEIEIIKYGGKQFYVYGSQNNSIVIKYNENIENNTLNKFFIMLLRNFIKINESNYDRFSILFKQINEKDLLKEENYDIYFDLLKNDFYYNYIKLNEGISLTDLYMYVDLSEWIGLEKDTFFKLIEGKVKPCELLQTDNDYKQLPMIEVLQVLDRRGAINYWTKNQNQRNSSTFKLKES